MSTPGEVGAKTAKKNNWGRILERACYKYDLGILTVSNQVPSATVRSPARVKATWTMVLTSKHLSIPSTSRRQYLCTIKVVTPQLPWRMENPNDLHKTHEHQTSSFRKLHIASPQLLNLIKYANVSLPRIYDDQVLW